MRKMTMASLLLLSTVCAVPASANYFFNSFWGTTLNVGSAPNPTPDQLRAIGDSRWPSVTQANPPIGSAAVPRPSVAPTSLTNSPTPLIVARVSPREEKRITAELNRASLIRTTAIVSKAPSTKKAASKSATPVKAATAKGKPPTKAAATTAGKKPRV